MKELNTNRSQSAAGLPDVSVVVPALNENGNVTLLVQRIDTSLLMAGLSYEIIVVDDHSSDGTFDTTLRLARTYPVTIHEKRGQRGKAFSILEGIAKARSPVVCMIDADLQYSPEDIAPMVIMLRDNNSDVVLSTRLKHGTSLLRQLASKVYNLVFTKFLFGIDYDTQSGLKVFRRDIFTSIELDPSPWSFDLEFILQCLLTDCRILTYDITFGRRFSGEPKLKIVRVTFELAKASLLLRSKMSRKKIRTAYQANLRFDVDAARAGS